MRYAILRGDMIDLILECDPALIREITERVRASGYIEAPHGSPTARVEPGGKVPGAEINTGADMRIDHNKVSPLVAPDKVTAADTKALDDARARASAEQAAEITAEALEP